MPLRPDAPSFVPLDHKSQIAATSEPSPYNDANQKHKKTEKKKKKRPKRKQQKGSTAKNELPAKKDDEAFQGVDKQTTGKEKRPSRRQRATRDSKKEKGPGTESSHKDVRTKKQKDRQQHPSGKNRSGTKPTGDRSEPKQTKIDQSANNDGLQDVFNVADEAFPTLGVMQTSPQMCRARTSDGVGVWADGTAKLISSSPVYPATHDDQDVSSSFFETTNGLRLTILEKESPNRGSFVIKLKNVVSATQSPQASRTNGDLESLDQKEATIGGAGTERGCAPKEAPRLNMSKLRDKWRDALRKQHKIQRQKEHDEERLRQESLCGEVCSEGVISREQEAKEEYVEIQAISFRTDRYTKPRNGQSFGNADTGTFRKYLEFSCPVHCAIVNYDRGGLESLIQYFQNRKSTRQSAGHSKKEMSSDIIRFSPLQLAVKLNRPDLLRVLLRAAAAELEEDHRSGKKRREDASVLHGYDFDSSKPFPTPLMMAADRGYEECVQTLLAQSASSASYLISEKDTNSNNALHFCCGVYVETQLATAGAYSSILRSLLEVVIEAGGTAPSKMLSSRNFRGQTAMHTACQRGRVELVEVFLDVCGRGACFSVFMKLLFMTDKQEQTPLLAAVASGSVDLLMTLLMWKGNHHHSYLSTRQRQKASNVSIASSGAWGRTSCPLVWAIKTSANVDVVRLLLEFHAPALFARPDAEILGYDLTLALLATVERSSASLQAAKEQDAASEGLSQHTDMLDIVHILVENGANPCEERRREERLSLVTDKPKQPMEGEKTANSAKESASGGTATEVDDKLLRPPATSALVLAATSGHAPTLVTLLDSLMSQRERVKKSRRRDHTLRKQPESFFRGVEAIEEGQMQAALSDALLASLFLAYCQYDRPLLSDEASGRLFEATEEEYLACSRALFLRGAKLGSSSLARLQCSLGDNKLRRADEVLSSAITNSKKLDVHCYDFRASYSADSITVSVGNTTSRPAKHLCMEERGKLLYAMPWIQTNFEQNNTFRCEWMKEYSYLGRDRNSGDAICEELRPDLVVLLTDDGKHSTVVHGSIVSKQSAKFEAAIRFAKLSHGAPNPSALPSDEQLLEVDLGSTPKRLCLLMLQHLYHGSIICGLSSEPERCCHDLLDLLLLSEEFLCLSLMRECEMRLLSHNPWGCFCWSCNGATTMHPIGHGNQGIDCMNVARGPPTLITPTTVIDVVAVVQHLDEAEISTPDGETYVLDFTIRFGGSPLVEGSSICGLKANKETKASSKKSLVNGWTSLATGRPLTSLREVSMNVILSNFVETVQSEAFASQMENNPSANTNKAPLSDDMGASMLLLRMCLDELAMSDFKEAWSLRTDEMKRIAGAASLPSSS